MGDQLVTGFAHGRNGAMKYPANDKRLGMSLREYGEWAQHEIEFLCEFIENGSTVVDANAGIGVHALSFAKYGGSEGKLICLEPQPQLRQILRDNFASAGYSEEQVQIVEALAGDADATCTVGRISPETFSDVLLSHVVEDGVAKKEGVYATRVVTLDSLGLKECKLIKVPADSLVERALAGMGQLVASTQPLVYLPFTSKDDAIRALSAVHWPGYRYLFVRTSWYNRLNIHSQPANVFGSARMMGLLLAPPSVIVRKRLTREIDVIEFSGTEELKTLVENTPGSGDAQIYETDLELLENRIIDLESIISDLEFREESRQLEYEQALKVVNDEMAKLYSSKSWRATSPLRKGMVLFLTTRSLLGRKK